ncbi:MAG TPA: alcohol dehydrogenase catalytic domain-containing protein [Anaerolineae bacterium]|nr:alcohol dehydrogenase catalytic domain-containing protein [Anaerolineae bacterium]
MPRTMKALSVTAPHHVELVERPMPEIRDHEVLVKTAAATICHTDHYILSGAHPFAKYPVTPGHEFSGVIEAVGSKVTHLKPGTRVAVQTLLPCGYCRYCWRGDINVCENMLELGSLLPGGYEEYVVAPAYAMHPIADTLSLEHAALTEPSANAHAVVRRAEIQANDTVVVIGPGPIGLLVMQYAKLKNPSRLILVGLPNDTPRLKVGKQLGATDIVALPSNEAKEKILELTDGRGADRVLQCAGSIYATALALAIAGMDSTVALEGVTGTNDTIPLSPDDILQKQITLRGVRGWNVADFEAALKINESGRINLDALITHRFPLEQFAEAFEMTGKYTDGVIKAAFVFEDGHAAHRT